MNQMTTRRTTALLCVGLCQLLLATAAQATTLYFSDVVSEQPSIGGGDAFDCGTAGHDPCITAGELSGSVDFTVSGPTTLDITLTNTATNELTISALYFSVASNVTGLTLVSATHSVEGGVLAGWNLNASTGAGGLTQGDGFGVHDYSLIDGVGMDSDKVGVGESIVFSLTISGTGPFSMGDFVELSDSSMTGISTLAAAKWDNGDGSSYFPYEDNDSGFGAVVPEPSSALLISLGLMGLGATRRRSH